VNFCFALSTHATPRQSRAFLSVLKISPVFVVPYPVYRLVACVPFPPLHHLPAHACLRFNRTPPTHKCAQLPPFFMQPPFSVLAPVRSGSLVHGRPRSSLTTHTKYLIHKKVRCDTPCVTVCLSSRRATAFRACSATLLPIELFVKLYRIQYWHRPDQHGTAATQVPHLVATPLPEPRRLLSPLAVRPFSSPHSRPRRSRFGQRIRTYTVLSIDPLEPSPFRPARAPPTSRQTYIFGTEQQSQPSSRTSTASRLATRTVHLPNELCSEAMAKSGALVSAPATSAKKRPPPFPLRTPIHPFRVCIQLPGRVPKPRHLFFSLPPHSSFHAYSLPPLRPPILSSVFIH